MNNHKKVCVAFKRGLAQLLLLVFVMSMFEVTASANSNTKDHDYLDWFELDQEVMRVEWESYLDYPGGNIITDQKVLFYRPIVYVPVGTTVTVKSSLNGNHQEYLITDELTTPIPDAEAVDDFISNRSSAQIKIESAGRKMYGIFKYSDYSNDNVYVYVGTNSKYIATEYTFYIVGVDETNTIDVNGTRFVDVSPDNYFVDPVIWAIQKGITNGTGTYSFSPNDNCTTAQVITFIWRAYGSPEPSISCPFANLTGSEYYYKAALWTYEKYRQAEGLPMESGKNFNPETECSRSMAVLYMWAAAGGPAPTETVEFSDVLPSRPDAPAISWAVQQGITNGTGENTFSPGKICTRVEIVTFLYRGRTMAPEEIAAAEARIEAEMDAFIAELKAGENSADVSCG